MRTLISALVFSSIIASTALSAQLLPFQGHLTTAAGQVIPDGTKVVQFKIYDAPVSGTSVWTGEMHKLSVNGGLVNTILGTKTAFPDTYGNSSKVMFSEPLYVEITVDANDDGQITASDPPLLPRQVLLPANFAYVAQAVRSSNVDEIVSSSGVIDGSKVKENTIQGRSIQSLSLSKLEDADGSGGITAAQIAENAVGESEIIDDSIRTAHLKDGQITEEKIAAEGFTGALIKNNSISPDRLTRDMAFLWDEKPYNVNGGSSINGIQTRELNKSSIYGTSISLSGNQFSLIAGTYKIRASAPAFVSNRHQLYLRNLTDDLITLTGTSEHTYASGSQTRSLLEGIVEVSKTTNFDIRHYTRTSRSTDGLGRSLGGHANSQTPADRPSIYTRVYIERLK